MTKKELEQRIEELVRTHIAECQVAVTAAVERAFATVRSEPVRRPRKTASRTPRRTPEQLAALVEQLYSAVCANPGETMAVLAARLETTPRKLQVPGARLKRDGRVRSVGQRSHTRYFPMIGDAKSDKVATA